VDFEVIDQLLIRYSAFITCWRKWEYNGTVQQLFVDFKKACDSISREVLYNILIQVGIPLKLLRLNKICLDETYSRVCTGRSMSDVFPFQNVVKQVDVLSSMLFIFAVGCTMRKVEENQEGLELQGTHELMLIY
jgi:hypothetical protein